jgi:hypothetical protein
MVICSQFPVASSSAQFVIQASMIIIQGVNGKGERSMQKLGLVRICGLFAGQANAECYMRRWQLEAGNW